MPSEVVHQHLIGFTDEDAIQVLPKGAYEGYVVPTPYKLGDNGSGKTWYTVRIVSSDDPALVGRVVNVGIVEANVSLEVSAWKPDGLDAD